MPPEAELTSLEFAALISSRICHDVISPVGAIANGLEILAEETDQEMREHAFELIRQSANQASAKLQFARLAFGATGSPDAQIDLRDAEQVSRGILDDEKHHLEWAGPKKTLPKNHVKLLLNMISIGLSALPRGGTLKVQIAGEDKALSFNVRSEGHKVMLSETIPALLDGGNGQKLGRPLNTTLLHGAISGRR